MRTRVFAYWVSGIVVMLALFPQQAHSEKKWYVSIYGARLTGDTLGDTFCFNSTYEDSYLVSLAIGRHLFNIGKWMQFELEGQVVKHFEEQHNWEFDGLIAVRWKEFPWNKYLKTSFAVGEGVSYATEIPEIEKENHDDTAKLLDYLMFEIAVAIPDKDQFELFTRIHHRSGAFGLFDGVRGASNALGLGIRYRF